MNRVCLVGYLEAYARGVSGYPGTYPSMTEYQGTYPSMSEYPGTYPSITE